MSQNAFDKSEKISKKVAVLPRVGGGRPCACQTTETGIYSKNEDGLVCPDEDMTGEIFLRHQVSLVWSPDVSDM